MRENPRLSLTECEGVHEYGVRVTAAESSTTSLQHSMYTGILVYRVLENILPGTWYILGA